jgi:hypothetical protein
LAASASAVESELKSVDLPTLGKPTIPHLNPILSIALVSADFSHQVITGPAGIVSNLSERKNRKNAQALLKDCRMNQDAPKKVFYHFLEEAT